MKNIDRRYAKHLSSLSSARTISGLFIFVGVMSLFIAIALGSLSIQSKLSNQNTEVAASAENTIATDTEQENATASLANPAAIKSFINQSLASIESIHIWVLILSAFVLLWFGYVLRVLTIVGETQLVEFPHE